MAGTTTTMPPELKDEANHSLVLDTLMYVVSGMDQADRDNLHTKDIYNFICDLPEPGPGEDNYYTKEIYVLREAMQNDPDYWQGVYASNMSWEMEGYNSGTTAAAFKDINGNVTVAFRGTGGGEWVDNAIAYAGADSQQQAEALRYFNQVVENFGVDYLGDHSLTVTGHSKGGNKAQYITLVSEYGNLIDNCYSFDGQGFSWEAIEEMKKSDKYLEQLEKMYSICGDNDFVNVLGCDQVFLDGHVYYIETNNAIEIGDYHEISFLFDNGFMANTDGVRQGSFAAYAKKLSDEIAKLPYAERRECARAIMQLMEHAESPVGDSAGVRDFAGLLTHGLPAILSSAAFTNEGRAFLMGQLALALQETYDKYGVWGVVGLTKIVGLVLPAIAPILIRLTFDIHIIASIVDAIFHFWDTVVAIKEGIIDPLIEFAKDVVEAAINVAKKAINKVAELAKQAYETLKSIGKAIVENAAKAIDWTKKKLRELGSAIVSWLIAGTKKIILVVNESIETIRRIMSLQEIRAILITNLNSSLSFALAVYAVYQEANVRRACQKVIDEIEAALKLVRYVEALFRDIMSSMRILASIFVSTDELQGQRIGNLTMASLA